MEPPEIWETKKLFPGSLGGGGSLISYLRVPLTRNEGVIESIRTKAVGWGLGGQGGNGGIGEEHPLPLRVTCQYKKKKRKYVCYQFTKSVNMYWMF